MALRFELFASGRAWPEQLWTLVGDPRRLPEWTDAELVEAAPEPPLEVGAAFTTVADGQRLTWRLVTAEPRLLEVDAPTPCGRVSFGWRVVREEAGARLVFAGSLEPAGSTLRARLVHLPALRRRAERWCSRAVRLAPPD